MSVRAAPAQPGDPDSLDLNDLTSLATLVHADNGYEYLALSDGWRRIRLDVVEGTLTPGSCVRLDYRMSGFQHLEARLLTLRRLAGLHRGGRLEESLYAAQPGLPRRLEALRVADALRDRASYREIAACLFGEDRVGTEWRTRSDYLLSRIRRRAAEARQMLAGGYTALFKG